MCITETQDPLIKSPDHYNFNFTYFKKIKAEAY